MTFFLAVWPERRALSDKDAARYYTQLVEGRAPQAFDESVYGFSCALTGRFPDLEMIEDADLDSSPWASALEVAGSHILMAVRPELFSSVFPVILQLAEEHGLVCFDPQNTKVHLPSRLRSN